MNWEDRFQEALTDEHNTIEHRRIHGRPTSSTAAAGSARRWWAMPVAGLAALVLVIGAGLGMSSLGNDTGESVAVASGGGSAAEDGTALLTEPTAGTPQPQSTATPVPATANVVPTPGVPVDRCASGEAVTGVVNVVNVRLDDPDGGLVLHAGPGVDSPVTGVLPPWGNALATGGCESVGGSNWFELAVLDQPGSTRKAWVNAAFVELAEHQGKRLGIPVQIAFGRDQNAGDDLAHTEMVTRWLSGSLASAEYPQALLDELERGPTEFEAAAGFSSELTDTPGTDGCGGRKVQWFDQGGPDYTRVCVVSAGVGTDARISSQIQRTLTNSGRDSHPLLTPEGNCFGDQSGENRCLQIDDSQAPGEVTGTAACADGAEEGVVNVVNVALDDPDGGLVLHSAPGVSAPVTGVLPPWGSAFATGECTLVGESRWYQLIALESADPRTPSWANASYLDRDLNRTESGAELFPVLIAFARDQNSDNFADYTETVTRYLSPSLSSAELRQALLDQLELGPTPAESAAGFASILRDHSGTDDCGGRKAEWVDRGGPDFVRVCVATAGVTTDLRVEAQIVGTFLANGRDKPTLLSPGGLCWGAVADESEDCYEDGNGILEQDRYDFSPEGE